MSAFRYRRGSGLLGAWACGDIRAVVLGCWQGQLIPEAASDAAVVDHHHAAAQHRYPAVPAELVEIELVATLVAQ